MNIDEAARTPQYPADVGYTLGARAQVSTSPKILFHDVPYERIRNAHPRLQSDEVEQLLEHALGMSVYEAGREGFPPPDPDRLRWVLEATHEDVERLLDDEEDS